MDVTLTAENLAGLTRREIEVFFGFYYEQENSNSLAASLGLEPDRIDQIYRKTIRKLRHPSRMVEFGLGERDSVVLHGMPHTAVQKAIESFSEVTPELVERLRKDSGNLDRVEPLLFEKVVAELMAGNGFENVQHVGQSSRTSADIFASQGSSEFGEFRFFVEVKREAGKIGITPIHALHGAWLKERDRPGPGEGCVGAIIVSLSGFAKFRNYSQQDIQNWGIWLKNREDLERWLDGYVEHSNGLWLPDRSILQ